MSSVPPDHGAAAVGYILSDENLSNEWVLELNDTRNRLKNMRMELSNALKDRTDTSDFSHIEKANGMFSYLGISPTQVEKLKLDYGIYMEGQGRINVAGITSENVDYLADSVFEVL
jgi:aspartate/tyrosine/aromatic aminotransferase